MKKIVITPIIPPHGSPPELSTLLRATQFVGNIFFCIDITKLYSNELIHFILPINRVIDHHHVYYLWKWNNNYKINEKMCRVSASRLSIYKLKYLIMVIWLFLSNLFLCNF
jgi:hypothetical protein